MGTQITQSHYLVFPPSFGDPLLSTCFPSGSPFFLPSDSSSGATSHIRKIAQGRRKKQKNLCAQGESYRHATTISMLPGNVLLEIFDFFPKRFDDYSDWHILAHVCQSWRQIVFASPRRLHLEIFCTYGTPVRTNLGIWPPFPIVINYSDIDRCIPPNDEDNVIAALEHPDRVSRLELYVTSSQLEKLAKVAQEPFPMLMDLRILSGGRNAPVLPTEFLGGSAPCLQKIELSRIPFPALPALLLSTSDLVTLHLFDIPPTGYISPEAMVVCLAALPRLNRFCIEFQSATSRPDRIRPPPVTRIVLPALTFFGFQGASEYLEDLVAHIDSPQLDEILISYLNQLVDFQITQLPNFINRSLGHKLTLLRHAHVMFSRKAVTFNTCNCSNHSRSVHSYCFVTGKTRITIYSEGIGLQVSRMAQVLSHFSVTLSNVVHLRLITYSEDGRGLTGTGDVEWQHLLHQFSTVRTVYISKSLIGHVAPALEHITEMVAKMLSSLDLICLAGQPSSSIEKFLTARRLSNLPVTVINTTEQFEERIKSYVSE